MFYRSAPPRCHALSHFQAWRGSASRFSGFIDSLRNLDWQLAITTTEVARTNTSSPATYRGGDFVPLQGGSGSILTRATSNAQSIFESTIQMSTKTGVVPNDERGVAAATLALLPIDSSSPAGSGLVRSDAKLAVVIVTDENVRSDGGVTYGFGLESIDSADSLINTVRDQFGSTKSSEMKVHSVIVRPGDSICYDRQRAIRDSTGRIVSIGDLGTKADGFYGDLYRSLSTRTGGITGSVCSDRYTDELRTAWSMTDAQLTETALRCVPRASPALKVSFLLESLDALAIWPRKSIPNSSREMPRMTSFWISISPKALANLRIPNSTRPIAVELLYRQVQATGPEMQPLTNA